MNEKTVRLFHKAEWMDINFAIRSTMTKIILNKMTITEDEIDNYVDTLTNTITSAIAEKVPTKTIKRNSIGLPIEIRELIRQKKHPRRHWEKTRIPQYKSNANRLEKRISKDITTRKRNSWEMYCATFSECQGAAWCKIRSFLNPKSAPYYYPTLVSRDEGGIKTRSVTTTEKLETFASQLEGVGLYQRNREQRFRRGGKDRRRRRTWLAHCQSATKLPEGHTLWPRYPSRQNQVRRSDWHTWKVNTRKACDPDHITNKIIRYLIPTLHIILQDLLNICVFHCYHPRAWKRAWALMANNPSKWISDPCSYRPIFPSLLSSQIVRSHRDQAVNELGREHWQTADRAKRV